MNSIVAHYQFATENIIKAEFLAPLLFRLIVAPVMIIAGYNKLRLGDQEAGFIEQFGTKQSIVDWFGNPEWGLGLPMPEVLGFLAGWAEFGGGWLLLFGLFTRLVVIPLLVTMLVAAFSVHWVNGWHAIAPSNGATSVATFFDWFGFSAAADSLQNSNDVAARLDRIRAIVEANGKPSYLYDKGPVVILNNGIQFAALYFAMLLSLLFTGPGKWLSVDYWLNKKFVN
ncbi:DoxX family protein [Neiella marina]|uniref:DoxX family protein n=1 Tax=Neiella holothuriorum TaxID=2870530 RepID=A0ABS7EGU1_9GAMM|nr:DoxX family protein [Neiella holothuriorum]MBW8191567.1 DoxX family protein [Neiella holothuriorum]